MRPQDDPEHEYVVGGKWGFIDKQGNEVIPLEYDSIANYRHFENGKALVSKGEKSFQINYKGKTVE